MAMAHVWSGESVACLTLLQLVASRYNGFFGRWPPNNVQSMTLAAACACAARMDLGPFPLTVTTRRSRSLFSHLIKAFKGSYCKGE